MPPFPERESSILAKLKKKKPTVTEQAENKEPKQPMPQAQMSNNVNTHNTPPPVSVTQQVVQHHCSSCFSFIAAIPTTLYKQPTFAVGVSPVWTYVLYCYVTQSL